VGRIGKTVKVTGTESWSLMGRVVEKALPSAMLETMNPRARRGYREVVDCRSFTLRWEYHD
jgi:hypothetical protein